MLVSGEVSMSIGTTTGDPYPEELRVTSSIAGVTLIIDPIQMGATWCFS